MKKALAFVLAAGVALPAFAEVTKVADFNTKNSDIALEAGIKTNGFTVLGEYVVDKATNASKEFTATVKYRYDINESFYVEPVASYTKDMVDSEFGSAKNGYEFRGIDTTKVGLKGGWNSDFGLYAAARYRYEMGGSESRDTASVNGSIGKKEERKVHRTDLTFGYHFDKITAQYNWVHKKSTEDQFALAGTDKKNFNSHEVKLSYTDFEKFTPYLQYSFDEKKRNDLKGNPTKSKDSVKIGVAFSF